MGKSFREKRGKANESHHVKFDKGERKGIKNKLKSNDFDYFKK